jgi:hypothetical protein
MYVWSKALAVALVVSLWGYGATPLQAKDHKHKNQSCQPQGCPAPVLPKPVVESNCCPIPPVPTHCGPPVQTGCCPVDNSKDVSKAQKEAEHAYHEAVEACQKRQKAIAKAQHEIDEKIAKQQRRIDRANDHFNHEVSELQDANAKYSGFYGGPTEAVAEVTPQPQPEVQAEVTPRPQPEVQPVAPQPEPTPSAQVTQPQQQEEIAAVVVETTPTPEPTIPKQLPKTAGEMTLIGLIGLVSLTGGYLTRFFRR